MHYESKFNQRAGHQASLLARIASSSSHNRPKVSDSSARSRYSRCQAAGKFSGWEGGLAISFQANSVTTSRRISRSGEDAGMTSPRLISRCWSRSSLYYLQDMATGPPSFLHQSGELHTSCWINCFLVIRLNIEETLSRVPSDLFFLSAFSSRRKFGFTNLQ